MKLRVGVFYGGRSGEHEVSLQSAYYVLKYLNQDKYDVVPISIDHEGHWFLAESISEILGDGVALMGTIPVTLLPEPRDGMLVKPETGNKVGRIDVAFPVLHGSNGEDGTIQGLFTLAKVPFVGAGVESSGASMNKALMKRLFAAEGLPQVAWLAVSWRRCQSEPEAVMEEIEEKLHYPLFVKPASLGSSVGITKVKRSEELKAALETAGKYDRFIVVEEGAGDIRECEVSVLGNQDPKVSVPGEIIPGTEFYDYDAKYISTSSQLIIPAPVPHDVSERIADLAKRAFKAVGCEGMARVDFFLRRQTNEVLVNEINTIPGFTKISMYPKLWEASGLPYSELLDRLIELALERQREQDQTCTTYHM